MDRLAKYGKRSKIVCAVSRAVDRLSCVMGCMLLVIGHKSRIMSCYS